MASINRIEGRRRLRKTRPVSTSGCRFAETCRLLEEAHHRMANHLSMLSALIQLKEHELTRAAETPSREDMLILLETIRGQAEGVSRLHRLLSATRSPASVDLADHLHVACEPLAALLAERIDLVEALAPGCLVSAAQLLPLTQLVSEAITNAAKHAYPPGRRGRIDVRCWRESDDEIVVEVSDGGRGLSATSRSGLGMRLMRALARQLQADLTFEPGDPGLTMRLTLRSGSIAAAPLTN